MSPFLAPALELRCPYNGNCLAQNQLTKLSSISHRQPQVSESRDLIISITLLIHARGVRRGTQHIFHLLYYIS